VDRSDVAKRGEDAAALYLERRGWRIVERNYRRREGEIDIIATRPGVIAFVEVKTRRSRTFGTPAEAVTTRKRARIRTLAARFVSEHRPRVAELRFDVVDIVWDARGLSITHLERAF
jgi:putative endonuclease